MPIVTVPEMTREEIREILKTVRAAIVPTGSTEQHGAHLPLQHDSASAIWVSERAAQRLYPSILVAPAVTVGLSKGHMRWPGTVALEPRTFVDMIVQVCDSMKHHGVTRFAILNGHGGNYDVAGWGGVGSPSIVTAAEEVRRLGVRATALSYWNVVDPNLATHVLEMDRFPGHSGEFETSAGLHIYPERVRMNLAQDIEGISKGAAKATAEKGRILMNAAVDGVVSFLELFINDEIDTVYYNPYGVYPPYPSAKSSGSKGQ